MGSSAFVGRVDIILFLGLLIACIIASKFFQKQGNLACLIIGLTIGVILYYADPAYSQHTLGFDESFFFYVVVPPMVFADSFSMRKRKFFNNFSTAALFGIAGTIAFSLIAGVIIFSLSQHGLLKGLHSANPSESLIYATILSMTEGHTLIEAEDHLNLHCVMFGESVLNDPVTIALFSALRKLSPVKDDDSFSGGSVVALVSEFFKIVVFSSLIGVAAGLLCAFLLKRMNTVRMTSMQGEITFMFAIAYTSYMISEVLDLSGAVTIFLCAVVMAHYCFFNVAAPAQISTTFFSANLAYISERFIYCYIGLNTMVLKDRFGVWASPEFIGVSFAVALVVRALLVFPLGALSNLWRPPGNKLGFRELVAIWWFGQLRGALSFALALNTNTENKALIATSTITIVAVTTVVVGAPSELFIKFLGIRQGEEGEGEEHKSKRPVLEIYATAPYELLEGAIEEDEAVPSQGAHSLWRRIDERFLRPVFGGSSDGISHHRHLAINDPTYDELSGLVGHS